MVSMRLLLQKAKVEVARIRNTAMSKSPTIVQLTVDKNLGGNKDEVLNYPMSFACILAKNSF